MHSARKSISNRVCSDDVANLMESNDSKQLGLKNNDERNVETVPVI